jgi:hypothetical protein
MIESFEQLFSFFLINLDPDERLAQNIDGCSRK